MAKSGAKAARKGNGGKSPGPGTQVVRAGQDKARNAGIVNTPVYHASTVIFDNMAALHASVVASKKGARVMTYGRRGTPTQWTLQDALTELEGGEDTVLVPSGLNACTTAILGCVKAGDHVLLSDSVYEPTRLFCETILKNFGVASSYYAPGIGAGIGKLMKPNTTVVFCESPGSHTFEVQDIPAIAKAAHARGATVLADNTWASPLFCKPLALGADLSIHAATKYIVGHSDAMIGSITGTGAAISGVKKFAGMTGLFVGPDDVYLATRGLRTLDARLQRHQAHALTVAKWLAARPEVKRVMYPALPSDPGYKLWKRDFTGASGLLGIVFKRGSEKAAAAMIDGLDLFALGYSWGGFESLVAPSMPSRIRTAGKWAEPEPTIRLHVGLEDPADLIADLEKGLARYTRALR